MNYLGLYNKEVSLSEIGHSWRKIIWPRITPVSRYWPDDVIDQATPTQTVNVMTWRIVSVYHSLTGVERCPTMRESLSCTELGLKPTGKTLNWF